MKTKLFVLVGLCLFVWLAAGATDASAQCNTGWTTNTFYSVGSLVSYSGRNYRCQQAHTSQAGWEPPNVPALWPDQGACSGATPTTPPRATATTAPRATATTRPRTTATATTRPRGTATATTRPRGTATTPPRGTATATTRPRATSTTPPRSTATSTSRPTPTPTTPPRATPTTGAPAWAPGTFYALNALVTYNGSTYKCINAHTSQVGWEPPNVA